MCKFSLFLIFSSVFCLTLQRYEKDSRIKQKKVFFNAFYLCIIYYIINVPAHKENGNKHNVSSRFLNSQYNSIYATLWIPLW